MMDMTKRVKVAMIDYIADLTGAGASQAELKIAIEMSKTVMDAMRSEQSECCTVYSSQCGAKMDEATERDNND